MGRLAVGVVALICVTLLGSTTLRADPAPQQAPGQDGPVSLLTQALKVLPASTEVAVERSRSDRGISNGEEGQPP